MRPLTLAEVNAINRLVRKGLCNKQIAAQVGRSVNVVGRVKRGAMKGKRLKVSGMDRIDIHAWWKAKKALGTTAQVARKYGVTNQYIRDICYELDRCETSA